MGLAWLAAAWVGGVAAAPTFPLAVWQWLVLAIVAAIAALSVRQSPRLRIAFAAVVCLSVGSAHAQLALDRLASAPIARFNGPVEVVGRVTGTPARRADGLSVAVDASWISADGQPPVPIAGRVRLQGDPRMTTRRGETIVVRGVLHPPNGPERGQISAVLSAETLRGLASPPPGVVSTLDELRITILERLHAVLPEREASLVAGVLLGIEETMPADLQEDFRTTGTAHILVVSGFNVTIVAAASLALFRTMFGARPALLAAAIAVVGYTLLAGADPPVVRAAVMAGIVLLAARLGRQTHALSALAATAILMTLADPSVVHDLGFQLSFLATLGLVVVGRPLTEHLRLWTERSVPIEPLRPVVFLLGETILITLVAQIATLPISLYAFGRLPLLALPANALILPAQPPLMAAGAATAAAALVSLPLGRIVAWTAWPFAAYTIRLTEGLADVSGASLSIPSLPWTVPVALYALIGGCVWLAGSAWREPTIRFIRRFATVPVLLGVGFLAVWVWKTAGERPDGRLRVTTLPAGAVVVETPTGRFLAVSAAPSQSALVASLDSHLPLTSPGLDWLVLTNSEAESAAALSDLGRHAPAGVLHISGASPAPIELSAGGTTPQPVRSDPGTLLQLGGGALFEVLDSRPGRWAARISMGSAEILLVEARSGESLPARYEAQGATAVIVLGPGRRVASALRAEWPGRSPPIVIGCPVPGEPFPEAIDLPEASARLTTTQNGWIRIETDGKEYRVTAERDG